MSIREKPDRKKRNKKKANYALQHVRSGSRCMVDEERLESFMTEVPIIQKPVQQINVLFSIRQEPPS